MSDSQSNSKTNSAEALQAQVEQGPEESLLEKCPWCEYSLRGLPVVHHCPECGLEVDRRWNRTFPVSLRRSTWRKVGVFLFWALLSTYVIFAIYVTSMAQGARGFIFFVFTLPLGILISLGWAFYRLRKQPAFVAIGPRGLHVCDRHAKARTIPWKDIRQARYNLLRERVEVESNDHLLCLRIRAFFQDRASVAHDCVKEINGYPKELRELVEPVDASGE